MNKKCRPINQEEYEKIITFMRSGFYYYNQKVSSKERIADALVLEANLGMRIEDILSLRLSNFVKSGNKYRIEIVEQKTGKKRDLNIPLEIINFVQDYAIKWGISKQQKLFPFGERNVQKYLKMVCGILGYDGVGTHSFRKMFAKSIYKDNENDPVLVQKLLLHSSLQVTQCYLGIDEEKMEKALQKNVNII